FWTMRQYAGFGSAEETNERYKFLLANGQTGLSVAFDLPTQIGYDSDHALSQGEVGKTGVAIDTLDDMRTLFNDIPLGKVSTSMTINSTAAILLSMYLVLAEEQGVGWDKVTGTIQNDLLKEYAARKTYIYPPKPSLRIITDIFAFCSENVPRWNTISISGYHIREAGSTAVQEIAFTLADGIAYVEAAVKAGMDVDKFAGRLSFFFNAHKNFLEEIAKFRAARRMWAKIMKERFGAKKQKSMMLRFHTQTAGCTLTSQQPDNNIVRVAMQAMSAVLGGTQSLHTNSRDEALALPTEESVNIALRTQQIIANESGVADTIDPFAGSYYVEQLTDEIEKRAWDYINKIDELGGATAAIEQGFFQREIQQAAYDEQKRIERLEEIVVGVNKFQMDEGDANHMKILKVDESVETQQRERLKAYKANRDQEKVDVTLKNLQQHAANPPATVDASTENNMMYKFIDCVRAGATLGEISDALREIYGEYTESF
ncbi:MAG: methylmalonyl-CoA mutase, partial [Planctomycetes bacterium]|nr:methylmalonyl-CoA mutase [Planctomycetota bacterium]